MKGLPRNPFEYGRELGLLELVDRVEERRQITATLRKRAKLFVIGPRMFRAEVAQRVGTTTPSLQKALGQLEQLDLIRQVATLGKTR